MAYRNLFLFVLLVFQSIVVAQDSQDDLHFYAIENLDDKTAPIVRGKTGSQGIPPGEVILAPNTRYREWMVQVDTQYLGFVDFTTPSSGFRLRIPKVPYLYKYRSHRILMETDSMMIPSLSSAPSLI